MTYFTLIIKVKFCFWRLFIVYLLSQQKHVTQNYPLYRMTFYLKLKVLIKSLCGQHIGFLYISAAPITTEDRVYTNVMPIISSVQYWCSSGTRYAVKLYSSGLIYKKFPKFFCFQLFNLYSYKYTVYFHNSGRSFGILMVLYR